MSVMAEDLTTLSVRDREWAKFMAALESWERHRLNEIGELRYHDQYVQDEIDLDGVRALIGCGCARCRPPDKPKKA